MDTITVHILPNGISAECRPGTTVLEFLQEKNLSPDAPCGGKGLCGKCKVLLDGQEVLSCQTVLEKNCTVTLPQQEKTDILTTGISGNMEPDGKNRYVLAFDIGTTTVVCYLLDGMTGGLLATDSMLNPQTAFGADVISRIQYVMETGSHRLKTEIHQGMGKLTLRVCEKGGIPAEDVTLACVVGNTAMHHLFLGIDPTSLTVPPYMPQVYHEMEVPSLGILPISPKGILRILPNIAGFVGADTVACLVATGFDRREELTLMIDIGTNGEMVLGDKNRWIACSTAAGPAFEGMKIHCGMRGAAGAIDHAKWENGKLVCSVIGGGKAVGICGSGLLDVVRALLEAGVITDTGRMDTEEGEPDCWTRVDGMDAYILQDGVVLTAKDVREVQLAKAAIRAGIELLARRLGVRTDSISHVLLAGAFGNYLDPASACAIGMIPPALQSRIVPIGNAAGEGSKLCAVSRKAFAYAEHLAENAEFLELASLPEFQDCYVDQLTFDEGEESDDD
ncbi:MAG: ASKHA domain-containing protein [Firmicutes bacterium]|nr:ASKHA domain-containing protein [Bacillota bacterium]